MKTRDLSGVGARLEEAVMALPDEVSCPLDFYEQYEMTAIQILDSEFEQYPDGVLQEYLEQLLTEKRRLLGIRFQ